MIQSTSNYNGYNRLEALTNQNTAANNVPSFYSGSAKTDRLSSSNTDALRQALNNTPEVRADVVKRAKELLADPTYPPREIIAQLSKLMVETDDPSEKA